jgi:phage repressor protein C with HTH and peptisase S24 domain
MQKLCNFADERAGGLLTVKDIIQIDRINAKPECEPVEGKPPLSTSLLYNISYGLVNTHRDKYIPRWNICQGKVEGEIFHSGIRIKRMKEKEIGQRIRLLRKALNLTQAEFGKKIGRAWNTINRWEAGEREIPDMALKLISQVFGVSYNWLKTGQGEMWERREKTLLEELEAKTREVLEKLVRIPVVGRAGAGFPESPADMDVVGYILVSKETFKKGGKFSVQVRGDSMEPALHDGDFVVFKTYVGDGSDIPSGKVVVVRNIGGELIVKRLTRINGLIVLTSDNPKYPPIPPETAQEEELRIVGVAVEAIKRVEL